VQVPYDPRSIDDKGSPDRPWPIPANGGPDAEGIV
jgi:hypothetical protein